MDRGFPGTPIDRVYIEGFLERHAHEIRGRALEVEGSYYTDRFDGSRVTERHVLDIDPTNERADIVGDLADPATLPARAFDTFVLTQTLQFIGPVERALENAYAALAPGGVILATVPAIARIHYRHRDYWRFTPEGLRQLLELKLPGADIHTEGYGNAVAAIAFVLGLAAEELRREELYDLDPALPVVTWAVIRRPA